ncbi:hypothetical protein SAMN04487843_11968 [Methylobacterium sp. ap11]|jgi:hypothetical protein|nr:hypothetical protein SAMN04487843_11968 [Methylobacterium sp. ap11]
MARLGNPLVYDLLAVADLESLDDDQCRRLAVLLITKSRLA